jgi:hypothetical protein
VVRFECTSRIFSVNSRRFVLHYSENAEYSGDISTSNQGRDFGSETYTSGGRPAAVRCNRGAGFELS